jgi:hypothetical protein
MKQLLKKLLTGLELELTGWARLPAIFSLITAMMTTALALFRDGILDRLWFVGQAVFCRNDPAGKPANNSSRS